MNIRGKRSSSKGGLLRFFCEVFGEIQVSPQQHPMKWTFTGEFVLDVDLKKKEVAEPPSLQLKQLGFCFAGVIKLPILGDETMQMYGNL